MGISTSVVRVKAALLMFSIMTLASCVSSISMLSGKRLSQRRTLSLPP